MNSAAGVVFPAQAVPAVLSPPGYRFMAVYIQVIQESWNVLGDSFAVPVHGHGVLVADRLDPGVQCSGLAEASPQADVF